MTLQKGLKCTIRKIEYKNLSEEDTLRPLYLFVGASRFGLRSLPTDIYGIIGLGIYVLETYTWRLPRTDLEGMGGRISLAWRKK